MRMCWSDNRLDLRRGLGDAAVYYLGLMYISISEDHLTFPFSLHPMDRAVRSTNAKRPCECCRQRCRKGRTNSRYTLRACRNRHGILCEIQSQLLPALAEGSEVLKSPHNIFWVQAVPWQTAETPMYSWFRYLLLDNSSRVREQIVHVIW